MEKIFIGIDVSNWTLDFCVKTTSCREHYQIDNTKKSITKFLRSFDNNGNTIIAMENTGRYNFALYEVLSSMKTSVYVINPLHLKRSIGLLRGENDKIDAKESAFLLRKII